jgi:transposase-like protein
VKYFNNIIEQDHRAVKRLARPMLAFKSFRSAQVTLTGIELMHMIRKVDHHPHRIRSRSSNASLLGAAVPVHA